MGTKVRELIEALNASGIGYCHWKSNLLLSESLSGIRDIDLLIRRSDASLFKRILSGLGFRPALMTDGEAFPSVEHHYALDEWSGVLVHVHAYFRVVTGESLSKNYRLPVEEMLLQNTREVGSVRLPTQAAELVIFTVRMMLKHTSLIELALLSREWQETRQEIACLLESDPVGESLELVDEWLPALDADLFEQCVGALKGPASLLRRIVLGHRMRAQLRTYSRHGAARAWLNGAAKFAGMAFRRLTHAKESMVLQAGGATIAFVGPEATGKSTLLAETSRWLGEHFAVERIHAGKPRSTLLSFLPNLLLPAIRSLLPASRSSRVEIRYVATAASGKVPAAFPLIFALRSVLLAHDRRALLARAFRAATNGTIVLCDRYPPLNAGAADGPQLAQQPLAAGRYPVRRWLAGIERAFYRDIPPPDLVILLTVPVEVAIQRNENRGKKEAEDYVRWRHAHSLELDFGKAPVYRINTDQPLDQTIIEVKRAIWHVL